MDVGRLIVKAGRLQGTDLKTLQRLAGPYCDSGGGSSANPLLFAMIRMLGWLDITLRLPFSLLRALGIRAATKHASVTHASEMHTCESEREWVEV